MPQDQRESKIGSILQSSVISVTKVQNDLLQGRNTTYMAGSNKFCNS